MDIKSQKKLWDAYVEYEKHFSNGILEGSTFIFYDTPDNDTNYGDGSYSDTHYGDYSDSSISSDWD